MKMHLIVAALSTAGLAACGEDRAVQSSAPAAVTSSPAAQPAPSAAQPAPAPQVAVQDEKKDEAASEGKSEAPKPQDEEKKEDGGKKAD